MANDLRSSLIAIPLGGVIGIALGSLLNGENPLQLVETHPNIVLVAFAVALVFGTAISHYFHSREVIAEAAALAHRDAMARVAYENRLSESHLKMLQSQIESHFLFNTLANVLSLIHDDPRKAEQMLEDFIGYLRSSLDNSRAEQGCLAQELELLRAYLNILSIRMGSRLQYTIEAAPALLAHRFPPLLLQPLVENAIKHGLEPKADGGSLNIRARQEAGVLIIEVRDTGLGMSDASAPGVGLGNVRDRLQALYQQQASLLIQPNDPCGVRAILTIPLAEEPA